jgi:hypothetical protein
MQDSPKTNVIFDADASPGNKSELCPQDAVSSELQSTELDESCLRFIIDVA